MCGICSWKQCFSKSFYASERAKRSVLRKKKTFEFSPLSPVNILIKLATPAFCYRIHAAAQLPS